MNDEGINILSLCDGMSCGQIALKKADIKVNNYYASEIADYSIKITQKNFPNTIQIGDMTKLTNEQLDKFKNIDILFSGTPCKSLSITNIKEHKKGLNGSSKLFYDFVRIKNYIKPKYFLFENVASMSDENKNIITELLEVEPIRINSNLVSAQDRDRYYWTNIPNIKQPKDKGILLKDIMLPFDEVEDKYWYKQDFEFKGLDKKVCAILNINGHDILKRVYNPNFKCATLTTCKGGNLQKKVYQNGKCRKLTPLEYERLQTVPEGYTEGVSMTNRYNMLGDGWTVDVIVHILNYLKNVLHNN